jgi:U-box domain
MSMHRSSSGPMTRDAKRKHMTASFLLHVVDEGVNDTTTTVHGDHNTVQTAANNNRFPSRTNPVPSTASSMRRNSNNNNNNNNTDFLICPITLERMQDPVLLVSSGHTIDKKYLCQWLLTHPNNDPVTGVIHKTPIEFVDNILVRQQLMNQHGDPAYIK